jgi:hypothetical protein
MNETSYHFLFKFKSKDGKNSKEKKCSKAQGRRSFSSNKNFFFSTRLCSLT